MAISRARRMTRSIDCFPTMAFRAAHQLRLRPSAECDIIFVPSFFALAQTAVAEMNHLPPGWSVSNSSGSYSAPAAPIDGDSYYAEGDGDDEVGGVEGLTEEDLRPDSPGWEDVEDDTESTSYQCLVCDDRETSVRALVKHAKDDHDLDLDSVRKENRTCRPCEIRQETSCLILLQTSTSIRRYN